MLIRNEAPSDIEAIRRVVATAFGRLEEADLVQKLRASGDSVISLVAEGVGHLIGHVLFSGMSAPFRALGLGPVSVLPNCQRLGIGSQLIRAGLERARQSDWQAVFVLGNPAYYRRFGFDPALAAGFTCRYAGPNFMALALAAPLPATEGVVEYAADFGAPH